MPLSPFGEPLRDLAPGRWLQDRLWDWGREGVRVGSRVPDGFPAYARILHPAYRATGHRLESVRWSTVAGTTGGTVHPLMQFHPLAGLRWPKEPDWGQAPLTGTLQPAEAQTLLPILRAHTGTPDRCYFGLWEGFGHQDLNALVASFPRLELPKRAYLLFQGTLETFPWFDISSRQSPNLWWPKDHAWVVASEIDAYDTYVAGSEACIAQVMKEPALEVFPASVNARVDIGSDVINV